MQVSATTGPRQVIGRKSSVYIAFSALGAGFLALQIYAYLAWIMSADFRPTPTGADPVPATVKTIMIGYEITSMVTLVPVLIWFIYGIVKSGKIDTTRALMVGWLSAYWLDPFLNFLRPMFTYNAYAINFGCWCRYIPGWQSLNGDRIAEPLLIDAPSYFYTFSTTALIALWCMRRAKTARPKLGVVGTALAGFAGVWVTMSLLDLFATRFFAFDAWPGSLQFLSVWGGQFYQFPIYEFILFPTPFVVCAFLVGYPDADGYTVIERGIASIGGAQWRKNALRLLAFIAFCNLMNLGYTSAMGVHTLWVKSWPAQMPSYLADEQCGSITGIVCKP